MQMNSKSDFISNEKIEEILKESGYNISDELILSIIRVIEEYISNADENNFDFYKLLFSRIEESDIRERIASQFSPDIFYNLGKKFLLNPNPVFIESYLDIFRSPNFLTQIYDDNRWPDLILKLLNSINYTFPKLF